MISRRNLIFLGAPGAGKGTLADMLAEEFGLVHISTGDILRDEIKNGTELGRKAKEFVTSGGLVPDEIVAGMVASRLTKDDCANGFILDGFPRTLNQAELLEKSLAKVSRKIDKVVLFEASEDLLIKRISERVICDKCKANFNKVFSPPKKNGVCDKCGGSLLQRPDDTIEKAAYRLKVYSEQTAPLIPYYKTRALLAVIDAGQEKKISYPALLGVLN